MRHVESPIAKPSGWPGRVEAAIGALFEAALANPGALRLSLLEIAAVGPAGIERRERSLERFENVDPRRARAGAGRVASSRT